MKTQNRKADFAANQLIDEKSPYLLQHAYNPVKWRPWEEEVFLEARRKDVPVFLSIGYSTCHWCHVMAEESFEDPEVAEILNRSFLPVKVDREERPDIDAVYMAACQALTGSGGWPLTIIMTPEKEPFFAGTYFPKKGNGRTAGLIEILLFVEKSWRQDRRRLQADSQTVVAFLQENGEKAGIVPGIRKNFFTPRQDGFLKILMKHGEASVRRPNFRPLIICCSLWDKRIRFVCRWRKRRWFRCTEAEFLTISEAGSADTRRMSDGWFLILKKCSMIMHGCLRHMPRRIA